MWTFIVVVFKAVIVVIAAMGLIVLGIELREP